MPAGGAMLITLTGPTGSGKSSLAQALVEQGVVLVPTWTTRELRPDEQGRGDIVRVTEAEMRASEMLEIAEYDGHWYGTPVNADVQAALAGRARALKILEPNGLAIVKEAVQRQSHQGGHDHSQVAHVYVEMT